MDGDERSDATQEQFSDSPQEREPAGSGYAEEQPGEVAGGSSGEGGGEARRGETENPSDRDTGGGSGGGQASGNPDAAG